MKSIGISVEGGRIVELTRDEYKEFETLCEAVKGATWISAMGGREREVDTNLTDTFKAIREWVRLKFYTNELQRILNGLNHALGEPPRIGWDTCLK